MTWKNLELNPGRFERWWEKFHTDHPDVDCVVQDGKVHLRSSNGSHAVFTGWYLIEPEGQPQKQLLYAPGTVGIILVRRGGYSVGWGNGVGSDTATLVDHKTGRRYVQGRTSAGGWSQQRFARRRDNQAAELAAACADEAARVLAPLLQQVIHTHGLAVGGDSTLIHQVLEDPRLAPITRVVRREFLDIPDPRFAVLEDVFSRLNTVRVAVYNP